MSMNLRLLLLSGLAAFSVQQTLAQTPKVVTDTRYARGATMAFGRIKGSATANGGSAISKRGFCLSEKPEPTVDDIVSTKQMNNNGVIYYFENLKPGTIYYMRAYATNKDGVTGYGDVIKFSTIPMGAITYNYNNGGSADQNQRINDALTQACEIFSNLTSIKKHFSVGYGSGTPTADCNYNDNPWMNVGPNASYQRTGTIMHEMQHGLGVIPYSTEWSGDILRSGNGTGEWLGDRVSAFLDFWDNTTGSRLKGDTQHMWPYGINGAQEDNGTLQLYYGNAMIGQALGEDGLQHTYSTFADPYYSLIQEDDIKYYIKNESADRGLYSSFLKPNANGALKWVAMTAEEAAANDSAAWYITFTPDNQYYQFRNAATGQYMTYSSGVKMAEKAKLTANENWHLMKGRVDVSGQRGYWIIHPEASWQPKCLQANASGNTGQAAFNIANSAESQRWLILTMEETKAAEEKAVEQMKKSVEETLKQVKALAAVPHKELVEGTDNTVQKAISDIETQLDDATSTTLLSALNEQATNAAMNFLKNAEVTDEAQPFDLTFMLVNPTLDTNTDGWSVAATVSYGCGEFYEKNFDFNQTVKGLPAGTYAFCANAFLRPGSKDKAASVAVNAQIYAGNKNSKLAHITADAQTKKVGKGREVAYSSKYAPDDMQAASAYFAKGYYENKVTNEVASDNGSLKVGIKCSAMNSGYWAIFDNFRLYFYGGKGTGEVTAIKDMRNAEKEIMRNEIYDLQGRKVDNPSKGIYIVNGKKVVIK